MEILKLQREATVDDLYEVANKAEIINGEIVLMAPTGFLPNRAALAIVLSLSRYEREIGGGFTITDNAAFAVDLPHRKSFSPDAAWSPARRPAVGSWKAVPPSRPKCAAKAAMVPGPSASCRPSLPTTSLRAPWSFGT